MKNFRQEDYKVFEMFDKQWALVTAGGMDHFNSCTIGWEASEISGQLTGKPFQP